MTSALSSSSLGPSARQGWISALWLGWLLFVVYGSLVPLNFQSVPLQAAVERFSHIRLLDVGVQGRGDWISNGVLYVPVGLLTMLLLMWRVGMPRVLSAVLAMTLATAMALAVEFTQVFFPPRTVSLNDLLAEGIGSFVGVLLAVAWLQKSRGAVVSRWLVRTVPIVPFGVGLLLVASLFPFDVLISPAEWSAKWRGDFWGWWRAPLFAAEGGGMVLARWLAEALAVVPLGAWWARGRLRAATLPSMQWLVLHAALSGAGLGVAIELAQWLVASGVSQGVSVFSRAVGWGVGALLGVFSAAWAQADWRILLRRLTFPLLAVVLTAAVAKAGWWGGPWLSGQDALERLAGGEIRFLPLYYLYYTSEGAAVQSVVPVLMLFAPLGALCWAWRLSPWWAALLAAMLSAAMELGRLWVPALRPDPSNVWIAAAAAYAAAWGMRLLFADALPASQISSAGSAAVRPLPAEPVELSGFPALWSAQPEGAPHFAKLGVVSLVAALAALWLWRFPMFQAGVGLMLVGAAALVWFRPVLLVAVALAALPTLNLTIWTGREYVDEFDVLLLVCLTVAWVRLPQHRMRAHSDGWSRLVMLLLAFSLCASALKGWAPWDLSALQHPGSNLSPWYSLRLFKGAVWAALLAWIVRRQAMSGEPVAQAWVIGMVVGLAGVLVVVAWERIVFVGPWNFSSVYRVAGPVLPMRLGGAYLDAYLVVSLPFALLGVLYGRNLFWRAICAFTALGTSYAIAVTYTRSTYLAVAVVLLLIVAGLLRPWPQKAWKRIGLGGVLLGVLALTAYPIVTGPFASARMSQVDKDFQTRLQHARDVISVRSDDRLSAVFGQGLGAFPASNYWARQYSGQRSGAMAVHRFLVQDGVSQLQLGAGPFLFLDQPFTPPPAETLQVTLRARAAGPKAAVKVIMCHKWLLASGECRQAGFSLTGPVGEWQTLEGTINSDAFGADTDVLRKPIRLSLYNGGAVRVDIDSLSVRDAQGNELVRNGGFDQGSDFWSYTSDDHLVWHVKNMVLAIWFDLGWLGLLGFGGLWGLAVWRSGRAAWRGDRSAQGLLAALGGLWIVALFDSVVDEPRFLLLLLLLSWTASMTTSKRLVATPTHNAAKFNQGQS